MKKKIAKIAALFASFVLVIVATVGVTLAYLSNETSAVINTFVAKGGLLQSGEAFVLDESPVDLSDDGNSYEKAAGDRVTQNTYGDLLAGMELYKDPAVTLGKLAASSYMFIEITTNITFPLTYTVDTANWTALTKTVEGNPVAVTGRYGGTVYVYSGAKATNNVIALNDAVNTTAVGQVGILVNNKVVVGNFDAAAVQGNNSTLTFYGYLCQTAGFDNAAEAYEACFPPKA